jgi:hypothetical protein
MGYRCVATSVAGFVQQLSDYVYSQFKATALSEDTLRRQAPSIFAEAPMTKVTNSIIQHWQRQNGRKKDRPGTGAHPGFPLAPALAAGLVAGME